MAVTETSPTVALPPVVAGGDRPHAQAPASPPDPASDAAPAPASAPKSPEPAPTAFGFALRYDRGMQRMLLEARDPLTGFVIFQMPAKYVIKQFADSAAPARDRVRGATVDSAV